MSLTVKQERFAIAYVECGNASEAYRLAYNAEKMKPATINRNAKALLDNNKIATRLKELRAGHVDRHNITVDDLTNELIADRRLARNNNQSAAAISATMNIAKLLGLADGPQAINFQLEPIKDADGAMAAMAEVLAGLSDGRLRPSDAKALADVIESFRRLLDTVEQREMLAELEEAVKRLLR